MFHSFLTRFHEVVEVHGDRIAVEAGPVRLTYRELREQAGAVAAALREREIGPGEVVGLLLRKSPEYLAGLLGTWLAGAAFLPLDPDYPLDRLRFMVQNAQARVLLSAGQVIPHAEILCLDVRQLQSAAHLPTAPTVGPDDLAYVIYTSGSTGMPKGVRVPHSGIVNLLGAQIDAFGLEPGKRVLWYLSPNFDASVSDIGTALLSGATLVLPTAGALETAAGLYELIRERRITHADLPPSLLRLLDPEAAPKYLETIVIGGEPCPPEVVRRWARRVRVVNAYGPTEATVCSSVCRCDPDTWSRPLIGQPLPGVRYQVLDAELCPVPPGVPGELCIGGIGLARGYVNRPDLDTERFLMLRGERLYRTGDRVVQHPDGEWEFLGRMDRQVKVRGLLIAPEEVEARLLEHPQVQRAAVLKRDTGGGRQGLVAFVVTRGDGDSVTEELKAHLRKVLPAWMVPQHIVRISRLPETTSGKADFAALAALPLETGAAGAVPPRSEAEQKLARIWERVLSIPEISVTDGFLDLGGDSLAVLEVAAAAETAGIPLSPALLMGNATIAEITSPPLSSATPDMMTVAALREDVAFNAYWTELLHTARSRPGSPPPAHHPEQILLTGATGFLGIHLLRELLLRTEATVFCLVRATDPSGGRERLQQALASRGMSLSTGSMRRIEIVPGDLSLPQFGWDEAEWQQRAALVDTIHHCGALVNMVLPYSALRPANVEGTREVLRFQATGRPKRLHYASTLSVFVSTNRNTGWMGECDDLSGTEQVYGGYAQSKWAAEVLLRAAAGAAGPLSLFRLGLITGDTRTGLSSPTDFLELFIRGLRSLGGWPAAESEPLRVDVTPVDFAAAALVHLSLHAAAPEGVSTFHIANPHSASVADLVEAMRAEGICLEERGGSGVLRNRPVEDPEAAAAYLALCRALDDTSAFTRHRTLDLFQATGTEFGMENTLAGLRGSGLVCPHPSPELLRRYVRRALAGRHEKGTVR